jgi:hypothetical protein
MKIIIPSNIAINCKTEEEFELLKVLLKSLGEKRRGGIEFDDRYNCWSTYYSGFTMSKFSGSWGYGAFDYYLKKSLKILSVQEFTCLVINTQSIKYIL